MALRTFPIDVTDADLVAAANAEGIAPNVAGQHLARIPEQTIRGMKSWVVTADAWAAGVDEWRAKWSIPPGVPDAGVRFVMRLIAAKTTATVFDPGS